MPSFRFLHAADLHLDSPLKGLQRRDEAQAQAIDDASRLAFDRLIDLAIAEGCRLVVIAGDVFDGDWRHFETGRWFAGRMRRLAQAGIRVVLIAGNHDAENRFAHHLELVDNVRLLSAAAAETVDLPELGATVHGRSFPRRDVTENLALGYPPPAGGRFNIGLLHTALNGRDGHDLYAPCSVEQLANHGYQYWALGHVHAREAVAASPWIVYPGNLQGRSIRETGAKGATLVTVTDGAVSEVRHCPLDSVRWCQARLDITGCDDRAEVLDLVRRRLEEVLAAADGRDVALRLCLAGETPLAGALTAGEGGLVAEIETLSAGLSAQLWIERVNLEIEPPPAAAAAIDRSVAGAMAASLRALAADPWFDRALDQRLGEVLPKLPHDAGRPLLVDTIGQEAKKRALALALALLEGDG
jgi:DNA repair exonuclease SbcCD nuclease subunit